MLAPREKARRLRFQVVGPLGFGWAVSVRRAARDPGQNERASNARNPSGCRRGSAMRLKIDAVRLAERGLDEGDPLPPDDRVRSRKGGWLGCAMIPLGSNGCSATFPTHF